MPITGNLTEGVCQAVVKQQQ